MMHRDLKYLVSRTVRSNHKLSREEGHMPDLGRDFFHDAASNQPEAGIHIAVGEIENQPQQPVVSPRQKDTIERVPARALHSQNHVVSFAVRLESPKINGGELIVG